MQTWQGDPLPPEVGRAAWSHGLGGPVTTAEADRRTITRRSVLNLVGVLVLLPVAGLIAGPGGDIKVSLVLAGVLISGGLFVVERRGRTGVTLYLFERGAVLHRPRRGQVLLVLELPAMVPYLRYQRMQNTGARWVLTVDVAGRGVFTCTGAEAVRLADVLSALELARVRAVLAAGGTVDYGFLWVTREGLVFDGFVVPWAGVPRLRVAGWWKVRVDGRALVPVRTPRAQLPHQRTLLALAEQFAAGARTAGRPG